MGALGDLLELLHDAHTRMTTFEVEYRDWIRQRATTALAVMDTGEGAPRMAWRGGGPWAQDLVRTRRVWLESPTHLRVEILENERLIRLGVRARGSWWRWDEEQGTTSGDLTPDDRGIVSLPPLLAPPVLAIHRLLSTMRFEPRGDGERAGRPVVRAYAQPRLPSPAHRSSELEFDAEHGTLLRRADFEDGERVWEREAVEVLYDTTIEPECFVFASPDAGAHPPPL